MEQAWKSHLGARSEATRSTSSWVCRNIPSSVAILMGYHGVPWLRQSQLMWKSGGSFTPRINHRSIHIGVTEFLNFGILDHETTSPFLTALGHGLSVKTLHFVYSLQSTVYSTFWQMSSSTLKMNPFCVETKVSKPHPAGVYMLIYLRLHPVFIFGLHASQILGAPKKKRWAHSPRMPQC